MKKTTNVLGMIWGGVLRTAAPSVMSVAQRLTIVLQMYIMNTTGTVIQSIFVKNS